MGLTELGGCANNKTKSGAPVVNGDGASVQTQGVSTQGGLSSSALNSSVNNGGVTGPGGMPATVYFGFDQYNLDATAMGVVKQNLSYLLAHPAVRVMIAGNTDPRGSEEYNFHLGERRANAVKNYFLSQGVAKGQLCTVSYGELKPAATPSQFGGDWHKAYALDRRSDIFYNQTCGSTNIKSKGQNDSANN